MFKRLSILARRERDDRADFARRWRAHGEYIVRLPGLRGYIQNHVIAEVNPGRIAVDGIVELWFDTPAAMAAAFESDVAAAMRADEAGFLGRATGYALAGAPAALDEISLAPKLFLIERAPDERAWRDGDDPAGLTPRAYRVSGLIAKPGQHEPPVPVARFVELTAATDGPLLTAFEQARDTLAPSCALLRVAPTRLA